MNIQFLTQKGESVSHKKPIYYGYNDKCEKGKWAEITICEECGRRALFNDVHTVNPCGVCGGKLRKYVGRWINIYRDTYFFKWKINSKIISGYWELHKNHII